MNTAIKNLFASALTAIVLTSSAFAQEGTKNPSNETVVSPVTMIHVKGNVKLHLSQGRNETVRVETADESDRVTIEKAGQKLFINSTEFVPADVYVTVKDLKRIDASGEAKVTTGMLKIEALQVFLRNKAMASVKVNAGDLYTVIKDNSKLKLTGTSAQHVSVKNKGSKLNTNNFAALKTIVSEPVFAAADLDRQFAESINLNIAAANDIK